MENNWPFIYQQKKKLEEIKNFEFNIIKLSNTKFLLGIFYFGSNNIIVIIN